MKKKREQMSYKDQAIEAAKDLGYGATVIDRIKNAKTDFEISRIMTSARKNNLDDYILEPKKKQKTRYC